MTGLTSWRRGALASGLAFLLLLSLAAAVSAHAELVGSEPSDGSVLDRAPERVQLVFSEPIERDFFALEVYSADRGRVDGRDARVPPDNAAGLEASLRDLAPGTYTVVWRILSIDGHVVRGAFAFSVGSGTPGAALALERDAGAVPLGLSSAVRWLTYVAAFALVGAFAFPPLILGPALRAAGLPNPAPAAVAARRSLWVAWPALVLLLVLGMVALVLQAAEVTGVPLGEVLGGRALTRLLEGTRYGALWLARMGLLLALLALVAVATAESRPCRWARWAGLALGGGLLLTIAAAGHASAVPRQTELAVAADWLHLAAGAVWVGELVQLALALPGALGVLDAHSRRVLLARVIRRFSLLASLSLGTLLLTGLYNSLLHVPSLQHLLDTAYGATLSGKLMLVVPLVTLGAVNLLVLHSRFVRAMRDPGGAPDDVAGRRVFRALVVGEVLVAAAVLAVTGLLAGLPPATTAQLEGRPFQDTQQTRELAVTLAIGPNQAGDNRLEVAVRNQAGQPVHDLERVTLAMSHVDMEMGAREAVALPAGDGRYEASGGYLSMTGRWRVEVRTRRLGGEEVALFTPTVGQAPGAGRPAFSPGRVLLLTFSEPSGEQGAPVNLRAVLALILLVGGVLLLVAAIRGEARQGAPVIAAVFLIGGLFFGGTSVADAYRRSLPNPVPATAASLALGQATYEQSCAVCHGISGRGDGPLAGTLRPRPADFRIHMAAGHSDQELYNWVSNGVTGTAMPAFKDQISAEDRWHVINYIRTFTPPEPQGRFRCYIQARLGHRQVPVPSRKEDAMRRLVARDPESTLTRRHALRMLGFGLAGLLGAACGTAAGRVSAPAAGGGDVSARFAGLEPAPEPNGDLARVVWPDFVTRAGPEVQRLYEFQIQNGDLLKYMPCFCGCGADGHRSNRDCYVQRVNPDGSVVLDAMAPT